MTIKLEAGKYYKRRDGEKVYCVGFNPHNEEATFVISDMEGYCSLYKENGLYRYRHLEDIDIIAEWVDEPAAAPEQKMNISEWWVAVRVGNYGYVSELNRKKPLYDERDTPPIEMPTAILQVKDWIAVQMGLKDIEEFKA